MLVLEIEYLTGVAVAASAYDRTVAEWPHPDPVFSALVCAWAERGKDDAERGALAWLERLGPPSIAALDAFQREVVSVFVPPNDMTVSGKLGAGLPKDPTSSLAVLPVLRRNRQPRQFPAFIPHVAEVRVVWPNADPVDIGRHRAALDRLVRTVPYLGHSSSLVRISLGTDGRFEPSHVPDARGDLRLCCPYPGRLKELTQGYERGGFAHAGDACQDVEAVPQGRIGGAFCGQGGIDRGKLAVDLRKTRSGLTCE